MKRKLIRVLSQRSTIVGLVGVIAAVFSLIDFPISAETELKLVEGVLLLVSFIAIMTKEEEPYDGIDRRADSGAYRGNNGDICDREKADKRTRQK